MPDSGRVPPSHLSLRLPARLHMRASSAPNVYLQLPHLSTTSTCTCLRIPHHVTWSLPPHFYFIPCGIIHCITHIPSLHLCYMPPSYILVPLSLFFLTLTAVAIIHSDASARARVPSPCSSRQFCSKARTCILVSALPLFPASSLCAFFVDFSSVLAWLNKQAPVATGCTQSSLKDRRIGSQI